MSSPLPASTFAATLDASGCGSKGAMAGVPSERGVHLRFLLVSAGSSVHGKSRGRISVEKEAA